MERGLGGTMRLRGEEDGNRSYLPDRLMSKSKNNLAGINALGG
jgi:hypothetical protein